MNSARQPFAAPSFGKSLAVFLTMFALVFAPCVPVSGFENVRTGSAADVNISSGTNTSRQNVDGNLIVNGTGILEVRDQSQPRGGAVEVTGNVVVEGGGSVNLTNNSAIITGNNTGFGGAIFAYGNVTLSGGNNTFTENTANISGGGIYSQGNVNLSGTGNNTFTNNKAINGSGGAIQAVGNVNISGTGNNTFTGNEANGGGAIFASGTVNISGGNNTFTENKGRTSPGGAIAAQVGAIISHGNNTFTGNTASNGGAIFATTGTITLSGGNNTFTGNNASDSGGAIYMKEDTVNISGGNNTFTNNSANGSGGAIFATGGNVNISGGNNTFTGNNATSGGHGGGAICTNGTVTLSGGNNNTFTNNSANGSSGGGAITAGGKVIISGTGNNTFTNNRASGKGGGAIYAVGGGNISGGNTTFTNNSVNGSSGGGAIYANNNVTLSDGNNTFTKNKASGSSSESGGGAIYATGTVTLSGGNNTFTNNSANVSSSGSGGGAIYATGTVTLSGGNNTFTGNNGSRGGAIYTGGNVTISGGTNTFTNNSANGSSGGGAINTGNRVIISGNATFENNTASYGGAIAANSGISLTPDAGSTITFKTASDTLATDWVHIGGDGNTNFDAGFNNPNITVAHFGKATYKKYDASAGWENSTLNVTVTSTPLNTNGWAATTGSGRSTPFSNIGGNFVLDNNQILSLDMNVANNTSVPYFTVNNGNVTSGTNTTLYGVIGSALNTTGTYTYAVFNVTGGDGTGFAPANYRTNNKLVTLANPTFYGNNASGTFTINVVRQNPTPPVPPGPTPDPDPPVPPDPPTPDPGNGTVIPKNETHSGGVSDNGGGLHSNGTTSIIQNATASFTGNTARDSGGGLHSAGSVTVLDNASAVFINNTAANRGGGIYSGGDIAATGSTQLVVSGNTANQGGGVYANGNITLTGHSTFTGNTAKQNGGAIFATGNVHIIGSAEFAGNTADGVLAGGAIHTDNDVHVTPDAAKTIRFITHSDSIHSRNLYVDGIGTGYFNAPNVIADTVYVQSGTAYLAAANTFSNTAVKVEGGTLHMGSATSANPALARMASVRNADAVPTAAGVTGSGSSASFATNLRGFHLGDGTTLSLDMNVAGNAAVPYFTLANGYAATTGTGTTLYGVIGQNLLASTDGKWTYNIFSGSSGAAGDFAPARYRTSNTLVSLVNPAYKDGTFTVDVERKSTPVPDPDPPVPPVPPVPPKPEPKPVITGDFMGLFPKNSLAADMEMILYYDYFYNGGTIANPGPGTLIGSNAFLDGLMLVRPNGLDAFTPAERLLALEGAASMTDMSGAIDMLRDTGNRLRGHIFATDAVRNNRATITRANGGSRINLWATPTYSHETGKNHGYYGTVGTDYRFNTYGGVIGLDTLFAGGRFRVGGVLTVGHGKIESTLTSNDADYVGGALFGAWLPSPQWEIGFYTGYIGQKNDVTQHNILQLKSKFDTSLWQIGTNVQYSLSIGNDGKRKFTAGVGADAQMYTRDSHGISANNKNIAKMSESDLTQVQVPLTVGLQDTFDFENGSSLTLDGRVGYRLTLGDLATTSDWSVPGGHYKARVTGPDADRNTALVGVGAVWRKEQLSFGIGYDAELSAKRTNHQLSGQVRWEF